MTILQWMIVVLPCVIVGCGKSQSTLHREAILRVYRADGELASRRKAALVNAATVADEANLIGEYCRGLELLDMSDCPSDFAMAYRQHVRAWRAGEAVVRQFPDGFWEGAAIGLWNAAANSEWDGGLTRMQAEQVQALKKINETYEEVERIGAKYEAMP